MNLGIPASSNQSLIDMSLDDIIKLNKQKATKNLRLPVTNQYWNNRPKYFNENVGMHRAGGGFQKQKYIHRSPLFRFKPNVQPYQYFAARKLMQAKRRLRMPNFKQRPLQVYQQFGNHRQNRFNQFAAARNPWNQMNPTQKYFQQNYYAAYKQQQQQRFFLQARQNQSHQSQQNYYKQQQQRFFRAPNQLHQNQKRSKKNSKNFKHCGTLTVSFANDLAKERSAGEHTLSNRFMGKKIMHFDQKKVQYV